MRKKKEKEKREEDENCKKKNKKKTLLSFRYILLFESELLVTTKCFHLDRAASSKNVLFFGLVLNETISFNFITQSVL